MTFRMRLFITIIIVALLASCNKSDATYDTKADIKAKEQPNFLFILVDDLGAHDLSCTGSTYYETPHIDRIANEGMVFTQGYAASRVCSPSRASIMTGQFTARHGITDWIGAASDTAWRRANRHNLLLPAHYNRALDHDDITIAEALKEGGYNTFYAGKWHLGKEGSYPEDHGFDINKGGWDRGSPIGGYFAPWTNPRLDNHEDGENLSMRLANETAQFIQNNDKQPFFAMLSFYAVHGPIQTTQGKWSKYRDKATASGVAASGFEMERVLPIRRTQDNPVYAGLVEQMDDAVGVVLDQLESSGLTDNTIVIFTSDNGGVASGDAFSTSNLPLRGGKGYQWEGGIREPYFIKVPWLEHAGVKNETPVIGTDFYPTILSFAGLNDQPQQHIDGVNLKPLLEGYDIESRPLYWHYPHYGNQGGNPSSVIRVGDWKLIHYYEYDALELYNLIDDPAEAKDLSSVEPEKTRLLYSKLTTWLKEMNANMPRKDELYDAKKAAERKDYIVNNRLPRLERQRMDFLSEDFDPDNDWWGSMVTKD